MPTDAPDGNINAHVVRSRRPDHVAPKAAKVKTHEPAPKDDAPPVVEATVTQAGTATVETVKKAPVKKSAATAKADKG